MASYNKFNVTIANFMNGVHNLSSDTLNVLLTNTSPNAADTVVDTTTTPCTIKATSNAVETAAGNGYTKTGLALTLTTNGQTAGLYTLAANQLVWTASGGSMAAVRYACMYDITPGTTATRPVMSFWDYGGSVTLLNGQTFTVQFSGSSPGNIFTAS